MCIYGPKLVALSTFQRSASKLEAQRDTSEDTPGGFGPIVMMVLMVRNEQRRDNAVSSEENTTTREYLDSVELEAMTGTPASTWRWWAHCGQGPASFKLGRRRVWPRSVVMAWLAEQQAQAHNQP